MWKLSQWHQKCRCGLADSYAGVGTSHCRERCECAEANHPELCPAWLVALSQVRGGSRSGLPASWSSCRPRHNLAHSRLPQLKRVPFLIEIGVLVVHLVQARLRMGDDKLTHEIGDRQRRQAGAHCAADIVQNERLNGPL